MNLLWDREIKTQNFLIISLLPKSFSQGIEPKVASSNSQFV